MPSLTEVIGALNELRSLHQLLTRVVLPHPQFPDIPRGTTQVSMLAVKDETVNTMMLRHQVQSLGDKTGATILHDRERTSRVYPGRQHLT